MNEHTGWAQGFFVDGPRYRRWTQEEKSKADAAEHLLVRPSPTGNAICQCQEPNDAAWIADRLNKAAEMQVAILEMQVAIGIFCDRCSEECDSPSGDCPLHPYREVVG